MPINDSPFKVTFFYAAFESIAIEYLSAVLNKLGYSTELIFSPHQNTADKGIKKYLLQSEEDFALQIAATKPDLVAFSVTTNTYKRDLALARLIKKIMPHVPILFGGIHPTSVPETVIKQEAIDYICIGEGEEALPELVAALEKKQPTDQIKNIWSKQNNKIVRNSVRPQLPDLDTLPFPDKKLFENKKTEAVGNAYIIFTGRGCPYNCSYCYNCVVKKTYGKNYKLRKRSVDNVILELKTAISQKKIKSVLFMDDTLIYDKKWFAAFAKEYKEHINLPYSCHLHPQLVDEHMVQLLEDSGCASAVIAVQTISETIRKNILDRNESNESVANSIKLLNKSKIYIYTNIIYNLPTQDKKELIETAIFLNRNPFNFAIIFSLRYNPALNIINKAAALGIFTPEQLQAMEQADENYSPLEIHAETINPNIITLLFAAGNIPKKVFDLIIKKQVYDYRTRLISVILFIFFILDTLKTKILRKKRDFMCIDIITNLKALYLLSTYCTTNLYRNIFKQKVIK